jgi:hypothetical protein
MDSTFILGPAGSGKSSLVNVLSQWMSESGLDVLTVNLDPGVKRLPYGPNVDVRDFVFIDELIDKYELGPNGAMILAMDYVVLNIDQVLDEIEMISPEYVLFDTPGQLEVFAYRHSGELIVNSIKEQSDNETSLFILDPALVSTPTGFTSIKLLALSTMYRLKLSQSLVMSKIDKFDPKTLDVINSWSMEPGRLVSDLMLEPVHMSIELSKEVSEVLSSRQFSQDIIGYSGASGENVDIVFGLLQRLLGKEDGLIL